MSYFSGQGRVFIGARDANGNPQGLTFVGNVPDLKVSLSVETLEHQESQSGQRLTDLQLISMEGLVPKVVEVSCDHPCRDQEPTQRVKESLPDRSDSGIQQ